MADLDSEASILIPDHYMILRCYAVSEYLGSKPRNESSFLWTNEFFSFVHNYLLYLLYERYSAETYDTKVLKKIRSLSLKNL